MSNKKKLRRKYPDLYEKYKDNPIIKVDNLLNVISRTIRINQGRTLLYIKKSGQIIEVGKSYIDVLFDKAITTKAEKLTYHKLIDMYPSLAGGDCTQTVARYIKEFYRDIFGYISSTDSSTISYKVDLWAKRPHMDTTHSTFVANNTKVYNSSTKKEFNPKFVKDFKKYFKGFDQFLDVLIANRLGFGGKKDCYWFITDYNSATYLFVRYVMQQLDMNDYINIRGLKRIMDSKSPAHSGYDLDVCPWINFFDIDSAVLDLKRAWTYDGLYNIHEANHGYNRYPKGDSIVIKRTNLIISLNPIDTKGYSDSDKHSINSRYTMIKDNSAIERSKLFRRSGYIEAIISYTQYYINRELDIYKMLGREVSRKKLEASVYNFQTTHGMAL